MNSLERDIVRRFKVKVEAAVGEHLCEVRVFGSRARGDAREDSDLDVFVMVDDDSSDVRHAVYGAGWEVGYEMDLPFGVSPLVMTRDHFEELLRRERMIARDIRDEGITV